MKKIIYLILISGFISCGEKSESSEEKKSVEKKADTQDIETTDNLTFTDGEYYFSGVIDHKYYFHMKFEIKEGAVYGNYYYDTQKKEILLEGAVIGGNLELDEKYNDKTTGHFISDVFTTDSISGIWKSPKGKEMSFALFNSGKDNYLKSLKDPEQNWNKEEFEKWAEKFELQKIPFDIGPSAHGGENKTFSLEEIKLFVYPDYDPDSDEFMGFYNYYFGARYETPEYIALLYTEEYSPGAFGIFNNNLIMSTFTKEGRLIDSKNLGCHCYDNNYYDYWSLSEDFTINNGYIEMNGEEIYASHEWAEADSMPVFEEIKPISDKFKIGKDGKFE